MGGGKGGAANGQQVAEMASRESRLPGLGETWTQEVYRKRLTEVRRPCHMMRTNVGSAASLGTKKSLTENTTREGKSKEDRHTNKGSAENFRKIGTKRGEQFVGSSEDGRYTWVTAPFREFGGGEQVSNAIVMGLKRGKIILKTETARTCPRRKARRGSTEKLRKKRIAEIVKRVP